MCHVSCRKGCSSFTSAFRGHHNNVRAHAIHISIYIVTRPLLVAPIPPSKPHLPRATNASATVSTPFRAEDAKSLAATWSQRLAWGRRGKSTRKTFMRAVTLSSTHRPGNVRALRTLDSDDVLCPVRAYTFFLFTRLAVWPLNSCGKIGAAQRERWQNAIPVEDRRARSVKPSVRKRLRRGRLLQPRAC